jgi:hypothetical protein
MSVALKLRSVLLFFGLWTLVPVATNRSMGGISHFATGIEQTAFQ